MKSSLLIILCLIAFYGNSQILVKNINTSTGSSEPNELITIDNKTYFIANDSLHGNELWITDGLPTGTKMVKDITLGEKSTEFSIFDKDNLY